MKTFIQAIGLISLIAAVFFAANAMTSNPENILQQIYLSMDMIKAILCVLTFCVCALYDRPSVAGKEGKTNIVA